MRFFLILILLLGIVGSAGCSPDSSGDDRPVIVCSIRPVAALVRELLPEPEKFRIAVLLPEGGNAHEFDPSFRQLKLMQQSIAVFGCGLPFERRMADVAGALYCNTAQTLGEHEHHDDCASGPDPHIWVNHDNLLIMGAATAQELARRLPDDRERVAERFADWKNRIIIQKEKCQKQLEPYRGKSFYVYHPGFGHFAEEFGLIQRAVERDGKEPSARHLAQLSAELKRDGVAAIFVQKGFSPAPIRALTEATGIQIRELDPMCTFDELPAVTAEIIGGMKP